MTGGWDVQGTDTIPDSIFDTVGYREFMDHSIAFGKKAITEFRDVKQRKRPAEYGPTIRAPVRLQTHRLALIPHNEVKCRGLS